MTLVTDTRTKLAAIACAAVSVCALALAPSAMAGSGGIPTAGSDVPRGDRARINSSGDAVPPAGAPRRVVEVIQAANQIDDKPYLWGGGHAKWHDRGYDCSGATSYALHGGGFVKEAFPGLDFSSWGQKGKGQWITVYASPDHFFLTVAGLRFDTGYHDGASGPRWSTEARPTAGFKARHPVGF
jgi:hypothetical protein